MRTLLVVGSRPDTQEPADFFMDEVADACLRTSSFNVARCEHIADFVEIVRNAAGFGLIDLLDIFDHGTGGEMYLGDGILFKSDHVSSTDLVGESLAAGIAHYLSPTAHVRLLGCNVASTVSTSDPNAPLAGRLLLVKLARVLGTRRTVWAPIRSLVPPMFGEQGFIEDAEEDTLFSSSACVDIAPPTWDDRTAHVKALYPR